MYHLGRTRAQVGALSSIVGYGGAQRGQARPEQVGVAGGGARDRAKGRLSAVNHSYTPRTPRCCPLPASQPWTRYTLRHVLTSTSAQTTRGPAPGTAAATGTLKRRGTAYGYCTPADPHHPQPTPATPPWHPRPHALAAHNAAPRLDSPLFPAFGGLQTAAAAAVESASDSCPRTMRRAVTSSLHAASGGCSASVAVAVAVVPPSDAAAVAATASAAGVLLSAKALPMANTLLRRLSTVGGRSATEPLRTPTGTTGVDQHVDQQPQCLGGVTSMLVDDCLAFVQVRVGRRRRQPASYLLARFLPPVPLRRTVPCSPPASCS